MSDSDTSSPTASEPDVALRERVSAAVDALVPRLIESVSAAVRIPSINPKYPGQSYDDHVGRESEVSALVAEIYREAGAEVQMVTAEPRRDNACARIVGAGGGRSLLLNGHVDVVPANAAKWTEDPFSGRVTDTAIFGRGATDNKAGVVAAAYAALALARAGVVLKGDLVLQAVVGEEVGDHEAGTTAAVNAGYTADAAIVVEPSHFDDGDPNYAMSTPGGLVFRVTMEGRTAHSSLRGMTIHPTLRGEDLGVNTIDKFWIVYSAIRDLESRWALTDRHPDFVPGYFSILPGVLEAHPVGFRVPFSHPDELFVEYCVSHHPDRTNAEVMAEVEATITAACANDPWLVAHPPQVEWTLQWPPYNAAEDLDLVPALSAAHSDALGAFDGSRPALREGFMGLCDATWLQQAGIPGVIYGPGAATTAHAEGEYVPIHQVITAAKTYALTALRYCGVASAGE
jgi:acetylornithine deacetylase